MSIVQVSLQLRVSSIRSVLNRGDRSVRSGYISSTVVGVDEPMTVQSDGPPIAEERTRMPIRFAQVSCATGNQ